MFLGPFGTVPGQASYSPRKLSSMRSFSSVEMALPRSTDQMPFRLHALKTHFVSPCLVELSSQPGESSEDGA